MIKNFILLTFILIFGSCSGSKITAEFFNNTLGDIASNDQTELIPQIEQHSSQYDPSNTNDLLFEITFSREIKPETFDIADIENVGSATNVSWILTNAGDNKNFTLRATGSMTEGTVIPSISAGVIVSADDEKTNISSVSIDNEITYDTTPVSVVIDKNSADPSLSLPVEFSISFSEPINLSSFDKSDLTIGGSATVTLDELENTGDNQNFIYRVLSTSNLGDVEISLNAMTLTDLASNPNTASLHLDNNILYSAGGLSVTIEQSINETIGSCNFSAQVDPSTVVGINFKVTFSEVIDDSTFTVSDITQSGNANVTSWAIVNCGDDRHYQLTASTISSNGIVAPIIAGGVVNRLSDGGANVASVSNDNEVKYVKDGVFWSGLGGDNNWSNINNWHGNSVPTSNDTAVFDESCVNCDALVDGDITVWGIYLSEGYSGTLDFGSSNLIASRASFVQRGGAINYNNSELLFAGRFQYIAGDVNIGTSTFSPGSSGNVIADFTGMPDFYNFKLSFSNGSRSLIASPSVLNIKNDLFANSGGSAGVTFNVGRNVIANGANFLNVNLVGNSNQLVDANGVGGFQRIQINSTGGVVRFQGDISVSSEFTYLSGVTDFTTSTITFSGGTSNTQLTLDPSVSLNNVVVSKGTVSNLFLNSDINIKGNLTYQGGKAANSNIYEINLEGDFTANNTGFGGAGWADINFVGSGDQEIFSNQVNVKTGPLKVNKSSGRVIQTSHLNYVDSGVSLNVIDGEWDMNGFDLTLNDDVFIGDGAGAASSARLITNCGALSANAQNINSTDGVLISSGNNPNISISDASVVEGGDLVFTVNLSEGVCSGDTNIIYATSPFYASASDFIDNDSTLVIPSGSLSGTITVVTNDDLDLEADEPLRLDLRETNHGTISDDQALGFILDNEAPTHVWHGDAGDGNFYNPLNWSGGSVPTATDVATFNGLCNDVPANCHVNLNSDIDVLGLDMKDSFPGDFVQGTPHAMNIGSYGFYIGGGNFIGGSGDITIQGNFYQRGGSFTSTSGDLKVGFDSQTTSGNFAGFSLLGGTFDHNGGVVDLAWANGDGLWWQYASYNLFSYEPNFYNFKISASATTRSNNQKRGVNFIKGDINVLNDFSTGPGSHIIKGSGEIKVGGDFSGVSQSGNAKFRLVGSSAQTVSGNSLIPGSLIIDSTSSVTFLGDIRVNNDIEYIQGSVDASTSTFTFGGGSGSERGGSFYSNIDSDSIRFNNVIFSTATSSTIGNFNISGAMIVDGDLLINSPVGQHKKLNGGSIELRGDLTLGANGDFSGGSTVINLVGSTDQTITSLWSHAYIRNNDSSFPSINVASTGGTVTFSGEIPIANDLTYTSGVVDLSSSHFFFIGHQHGPDYESTINFPGHSFNDVTFRKDNDNISIVGNMDINGNLVIHDSFVSGSTIDGGSINLAGDLTLTEVDAGGSTQIIFDGTTDQNITYTSGTLLSGNMTVNKSAGSIIQGSNLNFTDVSQVIQINDGDWNMNGFDLDINNTLNIGDGVGALSSARLLTNCGTLTTGSQTVNPTDGEIVNLTGTANITINNVSEAEGTDLVFTVSLSQAVCGDTNITYTTNNQSASAGTDYTDNDSTLVIASGATSGTITVVTNNDSTYEQDETLRVLLTGTNQGTITDATGIGTIENNDTHPHLWSGAGGNSNWTTDANWYGGSAPGSSDIAYFNGDCVQCNVSINTNINVRGIDVSSDFAGTITQNSGRTITIGDDGWRHRGGNFVGGNSSIDFQGAGTGLIVTGGSFTSTSGNLNIRADDFRVNSSSTFIHNSGTVRLYSNNLTTLDVSSHELWNFTFDKSAGGQGSITTSLDVNGTLRLSANLSGNLINGTIFASGDVIVNDNGSGGQSTRLRIDGSSDQLISASGGGANSLSGITFASTGGTVTMQGSMQVRFEFRHISGNVDMSNSTIRLVSNATATLDPGPIEFNNLFIYKSTGATNITEDITVLGDLRIGTDTINGNYDIFLHGDFYLENFTGVTSNEVFFVGSNDQTISRTSGFFLGSQIVVNKTGGRVTQLSNINLSRAGQDLIIRNGIWDMAGNNLTVNDRLNVGDGLGAAGSAELISSCGTISSGTQTVNSTDGVITTSSSNPNITINDVQATEGNNLVFTVSLTEAVCGFSTNIDYSTSIGTARSGVANDFDAKSGTLVIPSGSLTGTIAVVTNDDSIYEMQEYMYVNLTSTDQGNITDSQAVGTINDNDAASHIWTGLGGDDNWSTDANWLSGVAPVLNDSTQHIVFDSSCTNCNSVIDGSYSIGSLNVLSDYPGANTITFNSGLSMTMARLSQASGVLNLADVTINFYDSFIVTGGTTNMGTSTFRSFDNTPNYIDIGSVEFYNLTFDGAVTGGTRSDTPLTVNGLFTSNGSQNGAADVNAKGDVLFETTRTSFGVLNIVGNSNQTITSTSSPYGQDLIINSTGGTVTFDGYFRIRDELTFSSTNVDLSNSTFEFFGNVNADITSNGVVFQDIVAANYGTGRMLPVDTMYVNGDFTITGDKGLPIGSQNVHVRGSLIDQTSSAFYSGNFILDGSGDQIISSVDNNFNLQSLVVNKASGSVIQQSNLIFDNSGTDLIINDGVWNMNGTDLTINDQLNIGDGVGVAQSAVLNQGCSSITSGTTIIDPTDGLLTTSGENPVISISNASAAEGTNIDFNVTLSEPVCSSVTNISFLTDDDIASISDSDYTDNDGTLIIPAGASSGTISISTTADSKIEVNETLLVTLSSTDQGSLGTSVATGTINNDDLCPTGFVPVNGDENLSTNTFCVMAFEAKDNSGDAVSEASATPWVSLSANDAQARCSAISEAGYSGTFTLISNPEWMTIARDIERTPANWEGEAVGSGHIYRGHSDNSPSNSLQVLDELDPFDSTGNNSSQAGGSGFEQGRAHALTGGSVIWDFAGNVWEWTDWLPGTSSFALGPVDETASSSELSVAASGSLRNIDYKPNNDSYSSANSFGRWSGGSGGAAIRGGAFDSTLDSGAFALDLSRTPASVNSDVGFRCVYREKQAPIAYDFTAPDGSVDSESVITLQYADFNYDLGVSCTTSNFSNVSDSTPCSCDGSGVCTVGITGDVLYTGPANFDFTITDSDGESNTATVIFTINP